ncbi:MAG: hypothetical protein DI640_11370 [Sphingomonas taxi]|uniref:ParB/Sulfiredoxin domain-containing protein n=1 Tax=Sphingomonas taxi TaxID=1549858 RepID=A0A2W4YT34_9SPHN|nr:MAG: hypothetical protein DI640_11370 [Sphingomonas taxi]
MAWWDALIGTDNRGLVDPLRLTFDATNPRYTPDKHPRDATDVAIVEYLDRTADLGELVQSIASSGYIDIEPLIVTVRGDNLVVLEGNRRLAALKVLLIPSLARAAGVSVPELRPELAPTLQRVSVFRVASERSARELIGFKHINGPQTWDAYAKALYAAHWLDEQREYGDDALSLTEIAARMGDKHDTLYRIVSAVYVLQQAEREGLFNVEDRATKNFSFSHLYTALTYAEYRDFIGLSRADRSANPQHDPVKPEYFPALAQLLLWIFGSKSAGTKPAIRSQNPDLSNLKRVLGHPIARRAMMERNDLGEALEMTIQGSDRFDKALFDASAAIKVASGELANAKADRALLDVAEEADRRLNLILGWLQIALERRSSRSTNEPASNEE